MLSFGSSIQKSADLKTQPSTVNGKFKKSRPQPTFAKKLEFFFLIFRNGPKKGQGGRRQHCQRPQSVFEEDETEEATAKKKRKIKNLKNPKKQQQQNWTIFYFFFRNWPQKGAHGDCVYILSALKVFLERIKQKRPLKVHPPMLGGVSKTRSIQLPLED